MIKFGPSGADTRFYELGNKATLEMPKYLVDMNLDCFEYSFGRGVNMQSETALLIAEAFKETGIEISVHAPYYINFANPDLDKIHATYNYLLSSLSALKDLGGRRCVVHPGSPLKEERSMAAALMLDNVRSLVPILHENGYADMLICIETMGKINQMGTLSEIIDICNIDKMFIPCVDFGHINARGQGILKGKDDYKRIIDTMLNSLDEWKVKNMHVHFSKIEYGKSGELRHLTFDDIIYGPSFEPLAEVIIDYNLTPYIICESAGTQSLDALDMKNIFSKMLNI
ncbi:MAG: endonuclease IV [Clostridia bacterium]|nr:endonuclease IV [Clostridia bacterium]